MSNKEAEKEEKKGDNCLKTGFLKWSKDYASAAMHYDSAVKLYEGSLKFKQVISIVKQN